MEISKYLEEYVQKRKSAKNLLLGNSPASLVNQDEFGNSEYLPDNIKHSVRAYTRNKDSAIQIYKDFLTFLKRKGIEVNVNFPPISISNNFERLMFIAKYLQDPRHEVKELEDLLWVSSRTIEDDMQRLSGNSDDSIQICGKIFKIDDLERSKGHVNFPSTAHPLFLTPNLTQVLVTLKGLKIMGENPLYAEYARLMASDIWEQLSDYAKTRICFVLSELLPEDLTWYESLAKQDDDSFYPEVRCSTPQNIFLDCIKNGKAFYVEYEGNDGIILYKDCRFIPKTYDHEGFDVMCNVGQIHLDFKRIRRSAYTVEELL